MGLLESFYQDPKRWGYSFQLFALFNRLKQWKEVTEIKDSDVLVSERSVLSDKHIFALNGKKYGLFSELEWALYNEHYEFLSK
jgi:deoxyadenosine/deoxycytidine kinase